MNKKILTFLFCLIFPASMLQASERKALELGAHMQSRANWSSVEKPATPDQSRAFSVAKARLNLAGSIVDPRINLLFELGFDYGETELKDFHFDYELIKEKFYVRVGQAKLPFSRQMMMNSSMLDLTKRSMVYDDPYFSRNRDIGVSIHNGHRGQGIDWALGVYNGTGTSASISATGFTRIGTGTSISITPTVVDVTKDGDVIVKIDDLDVVEFRRSNVPPRALPLAAFRMAYNHGGIDTSQEADLQGGDFRMSIGLGLLADLDLSNTDSAGLRATADFMTKIQGFSLSGAGFMATEQRPGEEKYAQETKAIGYYAQLGYTLPIGAPLFRISHTMHKEAADQMELAGGVAWYIYEQSFKVQVAYIQLRTATAEDPIIDHQGQVQVQLIY